MGRRENTSNIPDCIRFATWNTDIRLQNTSAEVVERLMYAVCKELDGKDQVPE